MFARLLQNADLGDHGCLPSPNALENQMMAACLRPKISDILGMSVFSQKSPMSLTCSSPGANISVTSAQ